MCNYGCFYLLVSARAHVPPSEAAGVSAVVIFPVVQLEVRPLLVSAAVGQVLQQQLVRVDLSVSASSLRQRQSLSIRARCNQKLTFALSSVFPFKTPITGSLLISQQHLLTSLAVPHRIFHVEYTSVPTDVCFHLVPGFKHRVESVGNMSFLFGINQAWEEGE